MTNPPPRSGATIAIILAVVLLAPQGVAAYEVGVRAGLSIARLYDDSPIHEKSLLGFAGGLSVRLPLSDVWSFRNELLYVNKGTSLGKIDYRDALGNLTGTFETLHVVNYLEVPMLFSASVPPAGPMSIGVVAGPAVAFELSEQIKMIGSAEGSRDVDELKNVDVCGAAGIDLGLLSGSGRWDLEVRYTFGLSYLDRAATSSGRTGTTMITVGYAPR